MKSFIADATPFANKAGNLRSPKPLVERIQRGVDAIRSAQKVYLKGRRGTEDLVPGDGRIDKEFGAERLCMGRTSGPRVCLLEGARLQSKHCLDAVQGSVPFYRSVSFVAESLSVRERA